MTAFYKQIDNGYIIGIGTNGPDTVTEITEAEYNEILSIVHSAPVAPDGYTYCLTEELEWVLEELPPEPDDIDSNEALDILFGYEQ